MRLFGWLTNEEIGVPSTFRVYIDDSGEKEYGDKTSRYFVYAGVVVNRADEEAISSEIDTLKVAAFGTTNIEIKSNWVRIPKERNKHYLDPFGLSAEELTKFTGQLYHVMRSDRLTYVAAAIDKPQMLKKYHSPYYASALAYHFLLQRYQKHCARLDAVGYVTLPSTI